MIIDKKQYTLFGRIILEKVIIEAPFKIPNPMPDEACFLYMLEGNIHYRIEQDQLAVAPREAVLLRCGNYFSQMRNQGSSKENVMVVVHFHPEVLRKIYKKELPKIFEQYQEHDEGKEINIGKIKNDFLIQKYIEELLFYFDNPNFINEEILSLKLKEIILLLCQTENAPIIQQILSQLFSSNTYSFQQLVEDHILLNLTTEEMAHISNLSLSSFKREFKRVYHDTPANYIRNRKLEKAAELLLITNERITDVCYDCGFADLSHFSKCFQDKYHLTPSSYRLQKKVD